MESEEKDIKKRSKALPIAIGILLIIAGAVYVLSYYSVPSLKVTPNDLTFKVGERKKEISLKSDFEKKGIFGVFNFGIFNFGKETSRFKIETGEDSSWISVNPTSGTFSEDKETISIKIDWTKLSIGSHKGVINIKSDGGDKAITVSAKRGEDALTIIAPSPDTSFKIGSEVTLSWKATMGVFDFVNIYLLSNGCIVENIANYYQYRDDDESPGEFKWKLKQDLMPGGQGYTIRVEEAKNKEFFDEVSPVAIEYRFDKILFKNIYRAHQTPSNVQYIFSLRDQYNHAVIIEPSELDWNSLKIWENGKAIDYLESRAFLSTQDDFQLQVMLVLDFSSSMKKNHNGIEVMAKGAKALIDSLKETHQIGVIEFHKPEAPPSILQPFVTNKSAAKDAITNFATEKIYSDFSICWDAVYMGLEQFSSKHNPKIFRALLFLSDGFDNSSTGTPKNIIDLALKRNVHIYNIGVGKVHEENVLKDIAKKTGGTYVHAKDICVLLERFKTIIRDLGGQYRVSYITPKKPKDGVFNFKCEIAYKGLKSSPPLTGKIKAAAIYGDTRKGIIEFSTTLNKKQRKAEIFMWCEHTPRYVHEFHFYLEKIKPYSITLVPENEGGLCENWKIVDEGNGWFRLTSPDQTDPKYDLEFGNSGTICKITVDKIKEDQTVIPFKVDNSVYSLGQSFCGRRDFDVDEDGDCSTNINIATSHEKHE
ncbi:MAG: VWA domain-containing protein [Candidatus Scalindua sp.]